MLCPHVLAVLTISRKGHNCLPGWADLAQVLPVPSLFGFALFLHAMQLRYLILWVQKNNNFVALTMSPAKCGYSPFINSCVHDEPFFVKRGVSPQLHIKQDPNSLLLDYQSLAGIVVGHRASIRCNLGLFRSFFIWI
jgi:hypothetical protein